LLSNYQETEAHLMDWTSAIALAFALAFDAFAVAIAVGIRLGHLDRWSVFRLAFHFGFAQFGMPIIGWRAGELMFDLVGSFGSWLAAAVLLGLGLRLIWEQFNKEEREWKGDPTRGVSLIVLMLATSIDALGAGLSLALIGTDILYPALLIGVVAAMMTILGLVSGRAVGIRFSRIAGVIGGLILVGLAVKTVWP
jgi:putative Mn2+ efflux pump MntP